MKNQHLIEILKKTTDSEQLFALLQAENFSVTELTEEGDSIFHVMLDSYLLTNREYAPFINDNRMNPNIPNRSGHTAFRNVLFNDTSFFKVSIGEPLMNHPQFNVNVIDQDGNNYLQLLANNWDSESPDFAGQLFSKGINLNHINHANESCRDLIANEPLTKLYYESNPQAIFEKDVDPKLLLRKLLHPSDDSYISISKELLSVFLKLNNYEQLFKGILIDFFKDFRTNPDLQYYIPKLLKNLIALNCVIDIEECLALNYFIYRNTAEIDALLLQLMPTANFNNVSQHIKKITTEGSIEHYGAMRNQIRSFQFISRFDDESIELEESVLYKKRNSSDYTDPIMFGHLFSLEGQVPDNKQGINLESSDLSNSVIFFSHLMNAYVKHCANTGNQAQHFSAIKKVQVVTLNSLRHRLFTDNALKFSAHDLLKHTLPQMMSDIQQNGLEIITGWSEHTIDIVIKGDDFFRNNGGGCCFDTTTEHYKITKVNNLDGHVLERLFLYSTASTNMSYIQHQLHDILGLKYVGPIQGQQQTVGNCSFQSLRIALKAKYRLYLPEAIADEIYADTIQFFEQFYLKEFIQQHANHPCFPHILMRLITENLLPNNELALAKLLLDTHFSTSPNKEVMLAELLIQQFKNMQIDNLGVNLSVVGNSRLEILQRFLNDTVTDQDLETIQKWPAELQQFQGYHVLQFAVMNDNLVLAEKLVTLFPQAANHCNWFAKSSVHFVKSVAMVELLVKAAANVYQRISDSALDEAINADRPDLVEALLKASVKPNNYSASNAADKNPAILLLLIKFHPDAIKQQKHDHSTAMHTAALLGNQGNLLNMIDAGANPGVGNVNGVTPLHLALKYGHKQVARMLINHPSTLFNPPHRGDTLQSMTQDEELKQLLQQKQS